MIRNYIFRYQSLAFSYFWIEIQDSRHFQLAIYTVVHAESESAVRIEQFLHPEEKIKKNQPMRVSISYRKNSYYTVPGKKDRVFGHNSLPRTLTCTRIGGNASYQPPGAP